MTVVVLCLTAILTLSVISSISFSRMGMQLPGAWQGVPAQAQIPAATAQQIAAQGVGGALPQATGVVAYPMQQFQVSPQVLLTY